MANEAHKEPTMEEILASIRKIISDDAATPSSTAKPEPEIANDEEDDVSLEEVMFDEDIREESSEDTAEPEDSVELEMEAFEIEDFAEEEPPAAAPEPPCWLPSASTSCGRRHRLSCPRSRTNSECFTRLEMQLSS